MTIKHLITILIIIFVPGSIFADQYIVEIDSITQAKKSSYVIDDGIELPAPPEGRVILIVSQEDYKAVSNPVTWQEDYATWKTENQEAIDAAIAAAEGE